MNVRPLRVLQVSPYFEAKGGGVERVAFRVACALADDSTRVRWIASGKVDDTSAEHFFVRIQADCYDALEASLGIPLPILTPAALVRLCGEVSKADVVVVHDTLYLSSIAATLWAFVRRRKILLIRHVHDVPYRSFVLRTLVRIGNQTATRLQHAIAGRIVCISNITLRELSSRARIKSELLPNEVDADIFRYADRLARGRSRVAFGIPDDRVVLLFVGRFVEKKGMPLLRLLAERYESVQWCFAGRGPLDPTDWRLSNVSVLGQLTPNELARWYAAADLLVLPSVGEGFPLVVQEAMAVGLDVAVSTEVADALPGVAAHVLHAAVSPRSKAENLSEWTALIERWMPSRMVDSDTRRQRTAEFAIQHWSATNIRARYRQIVHQLIGPDESAA